MKNFAYTLLFLSLMVISRQINAFAEDVVPPASVPSICETVLQLELVSKPDAAPRKVDYALVSASGGGEEEAKVELEKQLILKKGSAMQACRHQYENTADCLAAKLDTNSSNLRTLSFSARKHLEESIAEDCKKRAATCVAVSNTEIKCRALPITPAPENEKKSDKAKAKK